MQLANQLQPALFTALGSEASAEKGLWGLSVRAGSLGAGGPCLGWCPGAPSEEAVCNFTETLWKACAQDTSSKVFSVLY